VSLKKYLLNKNIGKYRENIRKAVTIQYLPVGGGLPPMQILYCHRFPYIFLYISLYFDLKDIFLKILFKVTIFARGSENIESSSLSANFFLKDLFFKRYFLLKYTFFKRYFF